MAILATVVEHGSIRRAARELRLTPSAVSQQIRRLEEETGVTLLRRSTRRLAVTEAGEAFYEGCAAMVAAATSAHESLTALQESPFGSHHKCRHRRDIFRLADSRDSRSFNESALRNRGIDPLLFHHGLEPMLQTIRPHCAGINGIDLHAIANPRFRQRLRER